MSIGFASIGSQLSEIAAGSFILERQVAQLVQAIAAYSALNPRVHSDSIAATPAPNDAALQGAITAARHAAVPAPSDG